MIFLGFYYGFYCSTSILITDLSSLLLCLEQSYGSTGIVATIFLGQTFGGRREPTPQEITTVILLLDFSCAKWSASLHYSPSVLNIRPGEQTGYLPVLWLLVLENLEARPGQTWCEGWLDVGADKKQAEEMWCLDESRIHLNSERKGLQWR